MPPSSPAKATFLLVIAALIVLSGVISMGVSLLLGVGLALIFGNPFHAKTHLASTYLLKMSVVIMGFGVNFADVIKTTETGFTLTLISLTFALTMGFILGKLFKLDNKLNILISGGTAICGGSAIAALAPTVKANSSQLLIAISVVFLLNGIGLLVYPIIGHYLQLSQLEFGLWAALGIHDTSSVVGAAATYGEQALQVATPAKLVRALWIIPLVFAVGLLFNRSQSKTSLPLFILFFIAASLAVSFIDGLAPLQSIAPAIAKKGMAFSLFLIGYGFTRNTLKEVQLGALTHAICLWLSVSVFSLWLIKAMS